MSSTQASAITALSAHYEWRRRPPDERYASVPALYEATRARRLGTVERAVGGALGTIAVTEEALALREPTGGTAPLTHWSLEQLAGIAGAPVQYIHSAPAPIVSAVINRGLARQPNAQHQLFADRNSIGTVRAITTPSYTRVHHDELVAGVLRLMDAHPRWRLPDGYQDGVFGAPRVPSGAYLGDRDLFLFLVDGNRSLDDPTDRSRSGLFRGLILRNSDVGAAALTLDVFLFRVVCANHIIWGFQHVAGLPRTHVGATLRDAWTYAFADVRQALDADTSADRAMLLRAATTELGGTRDDVIEAVTTWLELPRTLATAAYDLAEAHEANPRSLWGYVQGLTRLSQGSRWQDGRFALDRAASRVLAMVDGGVRRQPLGGRQAASSVPAASWACEPAVA